MSEPSSAPPEFDRYARQMRYAPLGVEGQRRLAAGRVLIVGCGALGTVSANALVRAGVGYVRIVDRDFVELTNLQRQILFDEDDVAEGLPKAVAAARRLRRINSQVTVEPVVADVTATSIEALCGEIDVIVDGTDNFETRFLLNDVAVKLGRPWIFGGALGSSGQSLTIQPGETACLRCMIPEPPPPGTLPTCDTAGVLGPVVQLIAAVQAQEAIKLLAGQHSALRRTLLVIDLWTNQLRELHVARVREQVACPCCGGREFPWLEGRRGSQSVVLCGRNAVQLSASETGGVTLEQLAAKLAPLAAVTRNAFLLRCTIDGYTLTVFPDGRTIVAGTDDPSVARAVHARYVGG